MSNGDSKAFSSFGVMAVEADEVGEEREVASRMERAVADSNLAKEGYERRAMKRCRKSGYKLVSRITDATGYVNGDRHAVPRIHQRH